MYQPLQLTLTFLFYQYFFPLLLGAVHEEFPLDPVAQFPGIAWPGLAGGPADGVRMEPPRRNLVAARHLRVERFVVGEHLAVEVDVARGGQHDVAHARGE